MNRKKERKGFFVSYSNRCRFEIVYTFDLIRQNLDRVSEEYSHENDLSC